MVSVDSVTTERLLLRRIRESDLEAVFALHGDPEMNRFHPAGKVRTLEGSRELLALWLSDWSEKGVGYWAVERREEPGVVVGFGGVRHKELEGKPVLNLAYRFALHTRGSGYATETARAALRLAREHLPDVLVVAIISEQNAPSLRVADRLGLRVDRVIAYEGLPSRVYVVG